jgi:hypothetical protein
VRPEIERAAGAPLSGTRRQTPVHPVGYRRMQLQYRRVSFFLLGTSGVRTITSPESLATLATPFILPMRR